MITRAMRTAPLGDCSIANRAAALLRGVHCCAARFSPNSAMGMARAKPRMDVKIPA
jgi:hypothetical protein